MKFNRDNEMNVIFNSALFSDALQHQIKTDLARSRIIEASDIVQLEFFLKKEENDHFKVSVRYNQGGKSHFYDHVDHDVYHASKVVIDKIKRQLEYSK